MKAKVVNFWQPATLVGGGEWDQTMLQRAIALAPHVVAADGAADRLEEAPAAIVGDMDSIRYPSRWSEAAFLQFDEQESTDFEKCLYAVNAPYYIGVGFTGRRLDHTLAVHHALLARPEKRVVLLGTHEVCTLVPGGREISLNLPEGAIVSFYPLDQVTGTKSTGLRWSIQGLEMQVGRQIGTSNRAKGGEVRFAFDRLGALMMLDPVHLEAMITAFGFNEPL